MNVSYFFQEPIPSLLIHARARARARTHTHTITQCDVQNREKELWSFGGKEHSVRGILRDNRRAVDSLTTALLQLYNSFTPALLLLYYLDSTSSSCILRDNRRAVDSLTTALLQLYYSFTAALLLLYYCCTTSLLLRQHILLLHTAR